MTKDLATKIINDYNQFDDYKPTSFWLEATHELVEVIKNEGLSEFRNENLMSNFFVPKYGVPTNSFDKSTVNAVQDLVDSFKVKKQKLAIRQFLSGYDHALSDYRVFIAADRNEIAPTVSEFSESTVGNPEEQFEFEGKKYSRSSLNYLLGICLLKKYLKMDNEIKTVLEIGGGFGTLGEILGKCEENIKYLNLDIFPTSYVSHYYLASVFGQEEVNQYDYQWEGKISIDELKPINVLHSYQLEQLEGKIDLFVNFISFQEMEPEVVKHFLDKVRMLKPKWILLRNIREGKQVKKHENDHGVEVPILTEDYIRMLEDTHELIERNVIPYGYKTVDGFHSELTLYKAK